MSWKRGQVLWSLWTLTVGQRPAGPWTDAEIPQSFKRRVAILTEFGVGVEEDARAGQGTDQRYDLIDAIELAIALELMMFGWPQAEAADFVIKNRRRLRNRIASIDADSVSRHLIWILPQPYRDVLRKDADGAPSISYYVPEFTASEVEEAAQLTKINALWRGRLVLDIGSMKRLLATFLAIAPLTRRGRR
jgi:hypothetical protein